jgi:site-specific DNA recombinase
MSKGLAIIYDRASTQKQSENYTRKDVKRIGTEIAHRFGYDTEPEPRFEIKSGEKLDNREVMLGILKDVEAGKTASGQRVAAIIVPNFTRLSRDEDIIDGLVIKKTCHDHEVVVIDFNAKVYNFDNANDQDTAFLEFWFASRDKRQMMSNMMRGAMERASHGKYMGGPAPLGYKIVPSGEVNKRGKPLCKRVIDEKEAQLIKKVFHLYSTNSATATARALNVEGVMIPPKHKGRKGFLSPRPFTGSDVHRIVTNPLYAGWVRWGTGTRRRPRSKYLKDFAPQMNFDPSLQIISQKEFDRTQRLVKERRAMPARSANGYYPFSYILACRYCGGGMSANKMYKKEVPKHVRHHYACKKHYENPKACPKQNYINAYPVAYAVIPFVAKVIKDKTRLVEALGRAATEYSKSGALEALEVDTRAELEKTEQGIQRLMDAIAEGLISKQEAKTKLDELREKKERLTKDIEDFENRAQIQAELLDAISYLRDDLENVLWELLKEKPNVLGRILRMIFRKHSVVVEAYGEMKVRKGRITKYELQEGFGEYSENNDESGTTVGVSTRSAARS